MRGGETSTSSYLRHLYCIVLVYPKHLNGEHFTLLISGLPNVGESTRCDGVLAFREGRLDFVRVRKQPVYATNLAQRSDASFVNIGFGGKDINGLGPPETVNGEQPVIKTNQDILCLNHRCMLAV